jgi:peptidoglycan/LPS O-acetylase OafA/YrhL
MLLVATPVTAAFAFLSWHLVEKRFLGFKSSRFLDRDPAISATETQLTEAF